MKKLFVILLSFAISFASAQEKPQERTPFDVVRSSSYGFELLKISNSSFNAFSSQMNLQADGYFFEVRGDSLRAEAPFVGKMTNPSPGLDSNKIKIDCTIKDLQVKEMAKGKKLRVTMKAYSDYSKEMFDVMLVVTESSSADLTFRSSKRDNITFFGKVYPLSADK